MKRILILSIMCVCFVPAQAQFLKKIKDKIDQSAKDVKTKVKNKAETAPDRVIDHSATKVQTKAESKIENKENKANGKVDKAVDKVDSIKIKKAKTEEVKDTTQNKTGIIFPDNFKKQMLAVKNMEALFYNFNSTALLFFYKPRNFFI